jgi:hypothetical protein
MMAIAIFTQLLRDQAWPVSIEPVRSGARKRREGRKKRDRGRRAPRAETNLGCAVGRVVVVPNPECYSVSGVSVLAKNIYVERRCFHPIHQGQGGHLTKKGRRGKPSAKLGVARRMPKDAERVMTAPISNSARHRHLLARPVSSGGRGSDPTRPYPSHTIPSLADSRAPLPHTPPF